MPTESTFILASVFIILAATGWALGYFGERGEQPPLNIDYLKGLNFLLNEQTDQAVDHFLKMVRVDDTTIETHFALGNLFRKRGEVYRAIKIHQNIIARPDITDEQRNQAFYSLAKDYLHAGLFDRAEVLFVRLNDKSEFMSESLKNLISIYEQEKEWSKAIEIAKKLNKLYYDDSLDMQISHYHCESAEEAIDEKNYDKAITRLNSVNSKNNKTLRIELIFAKLNAIQGYEKKAIDIYFNILRQNNYFVAEALPLVFNIFKNQNNLQEFDKKLNFLINQKPNISNLIAYTALASNIEYSKSIDNCIEGYIRSDEALSEFINVNDIFQSELDIKDSSIKKIKHGLMVLANNNPRYQCNECGFSSQKLLWQCPSCKAWETQRPFLSVKFDSLLQRKVIDA
jgi:lipopolysaccharide biosynthesis regulator YciM